jgi:hypothetical protein
MAAGELLPDELTDGVVRERLESRHLAPNWSNVRGAGDGDEQPPDDSEAASARRLKIRNQQTEAVRDALEAWTDLSTRGATATHGSTSEPEWVIFELTELRDVQHLAG